MSSPTKSQTFKQVSLEAGSINFSFEYQESGASMGSPSSSPQRVGAGVGGSRTPRTPTIHQQQQHRRSSAASRSSDKSKSRAAAADAEDTSTTETRSTLPSSKKKSSSRRRSSRKEEQNFIRSTIDELDDIIFGCNPIRPCTDDDDPRALKGCMSDERYTNGTAAMIMCDKMKEAARWNAANTFDDDSLTGIGKIAIKTSGDTMEYSEYDELSPRTVEDDEETLNTLNDEDRNDTVGLVKDSSVAVPRDQSSKPTAAAAAAKKKKAPPSQKLQPTIMTPNSQQMEMPTRSFFENDTPRIGSISRRPSGVLCDEPKSYSFAAFPGTPGAGANQGPPRMRSIETATSGATKSTFTGFHPEDSSAASPSVVHVKEPKEPSLVNEKMKDDDDKTKELKGERLLLGAATAASAAAGVVAITEIGGTANGSTEVEEEPLVIESFDYDNNGHVIKDPVVEADVAVDNSNMSANTSPSQYRPAPVDPPTEHVDTVIENEEVIEKEPSATSNANKTTIKHIDAIEKESSAPTNANATANKHNDTNEKESPSTRASVSPTPIKSLCCNDKRMEADEAPVKAVEASVETKPAGSPIVTERDELDIIIEQVDYEMRKEPIEHIAKQEDKESDGSTKGTAQDQSSYLEGVLSANAQTEDPHEDYEVSYEQHKKVVDKRLGKSCCDWRVWLAALIAIVALAIGLFFGMTKSKRNTAIASTAIASTIERGGGVPVSAALSPFKMQMELAEGSDFDEQILEDVTEAHLSAPMKSLLDNFDELQLDATVSKQRRRLGFETNKAIEASFEGTVILLDDSILPTQEKLDAIVSDAFSGENFDSYVASMAASEMELSSLNVVDKSGNDLGSSLSQVSEITPEETAAQTEKNEPEPTAQANNPKDDTAEKDVASTSEPTASPISSNPTAAPASANPTVSPTSEPVTNEPSPKPTPVTSAPASTEPTISPASANPTSISVSTTKSPTTARTSSKPTSTLEPTLSPSSKLIDSIAADNVADEKEGEEQSHKHNKEEEDPVIIDDSASSSASTDKEPTASPVAAPIAADNLDDSAPSSASTDKEPTASPVAAPIAADNLADDDKGKEQGNGDNEENEDPVIIDDSASSSASTDKEPTASPVAAPIAADNLDDSASSSASTDKEPTASPVAAPIAADNLDDSAPSSASTDKEPTASPVAAPIAADNLDDSAPSSASTDKEPTASPVAAPIAADNLDDSAPSSASTDKEPTASPVAAPIAADNLADDDKGKEQGNEDNEENEDPVIIDDSAPSSASTDKEPTASPVAAPIAADNLADDDKGKEQGNEDNEENEDPVIIDDSAPSSASTDKEPTASPIAAPIAADNLADDDKGKEQGNEDNEENEDPVIIDDSAPSSASTDKEPTASPVAAPIAADNLADDDKGKEQDKKDKQGKEEGPVIADNLAVEKKIKKKGKGKKDRKEAYPFIPDSHPLKVIDVSTPAPSSASLTEEPNSSPASASPPTASNVANNLADAHNEKADPVLIDDTSEPEEDVSTHAPSAALSTKSPTADPTSKEPTSSPTALPTNALSARPTDTPTSRSTDVLSARPTFMPSSIPTLPPTDQPETKPPTTLSPSLNPTLSPTPWPSLKPTVSPSLNPTQMPTVPPSHNPTTDPPTPLPILDDSKPGFLVTGFHSTSSTDGMMFNVIAKEFDITITNIDIQLDSEASNIPVEVISIQSSYVGWELYSRIWHSSNKYTIPNGNGYGKLTTVSNDFKPIKVPAGRTVGIYVTLSEGHQMLVGSGFETTSDDNIQIYSGADVGNRFKSVTRGVSWTGAIHYTVE